MTRPQRGCALVTGASRGIGAAIALRLATDQWSVAVNYSSDSQGARKVVEEIAANGGQALEVQADVADEGAVQSMFDTVEEELGPVLVLVNNAGVRHDRLAQGLSGEDWSRVIDVNLNGAFHTTNRAIGAMVKTRFGRIVNISSISATRPQPGQSAYAASKAGLEGFTRSLAQEVSRRGVTVNAIAPGLIETDFLPEQIATDEARSAVPARRFGEPEEVASLVSYLVSEEAGYVSGTVISMDGGFSAGLGTAGRYWQPKPQNPSS